MFVCAAVHCDLDAFAASPADGWLTPTSPSTRSSLAAAIRVVSSTPARCFVHNKTPVHANTATTIATTTKCGQTLMSCIEPSPIIALKGQQTLYQVLQRPCHRRLKLHHVMFNHFISSRLGGLYKCLRVGSSVVI